MKKLVLTALILLVLIGGFVLTQNNKQASAETLTEPWIVIEADTVNEIDATGAIVRQLETGDEVPAGVTIQTDATGEATLYFPDGSQARIEQNTTLTVTEATYDPETDTLIAKLSLTGGKLWSNVVSFVNPESSWEVETAHAVATVRGTSFGTDTTSESSAFIGSESTVAIFALDPETGEPVLETETDITTDEAIELTAEDVQLLISEKREIAKKRIEDLTRERILEWVERQREHDGPLAERYRELEEQGLTAKEIRSTIRTEVQERFATQVAERRLELQQKLHDNKNSVEQQTTEPIVERLSIDEMRSQLIAVFTAMNSTALVTEIQNLSDAELLAKIQEHLGDDFQELFKNPELLQQRLKEVLQEEVTKEEVLQKEVPEEKQTASPKPTTIKIRTTTDLSQTITEGTDMRLEALLVFSDGSTKNITDTANWSVIGPIGSMVSPGVFRPKLDPSVAEFGESSGAITATWKDGLTAFLGKTSIFKVVPKIPDTKNLQG